MIISAGLVDKEGTVFVARQYCEMARSKVESMYLAFSRLIVKGKQHTIVESATARFLYQAVNEFYMVVVTDKDSNVLEDIKSLKLYVSAVIEFASAGKAGVNEESITRNRFDLLFAFDEICCLGVRQIDDLAELKDCMRMESQEEQDYVRNLDKKEREAKAIAAEKSKELDRQRRNEALLQSNRYKSGGISSESSISRPVDPTPEKVAEPQKPTKIMSRGRALKLRPKK